MSFLGKFFHSFNPSEPGFMFMWVLLMVGVFSAAITLERMFFLLSRMGSGRKAFVEEVFEKVSNNNLDGAVKQCEEAGKMALAQVIQSILAAAAAGEKRITSTLEEAILRVIPPLEKRTGYLATIGNVATLTGLMGTIYGLILSFASVGKPGIDAVEKSTLLASGIAAAMNTTFMGLLIAIPAIVIYALIKSKTQDMIDEIDEHSLRCANLLSEKWTMLTDSEFDPDSGGNTLTLRVQGKSVKVYAEDKLIKPMKN